MIELSTFYLALSIWAYALFGGADFGMGIVELLFPQQKEALQNLSKRVIGPIWEANHIWIIFAIVILFIAFPDLFYTLCIYFHLPIFLMLIGIVIRGTAFSFLHYDPTKDFSHRIHAFFFKAASFITPLILGMMMAAFMSELPAIKNGIATDFFFWCHPFSLASGLLFVSLCTQNALCFLHFETANPELIKGLQTRFKKVWKVSLGLFFLSGLLAALHDADFRSPRMLFLALLIVGLFFIQKRSLSLRRRLSTYLSTALLVLHFLLGLIVSQFPIILKTPTQDFHLFKSTAPVITIHLLNTTLTLGLILVLPFLFYLFKTFSKDR